MTTHTFATPEPIKLDVELGSGRLTVSPADVAETTITIAGRDAEEFTVTQDGDLVSVIAPKHNSGLFGKDNRADVQVTLPEESALRARTGSADVTAEHTLRSAQVKTGSGDITVARVNGPADLGTGSGDVRVAHVAGAAKVKTGSGDVRFGTAEQGVSVNTGSGDVALGEVTGSIEIKTGSGDLRIQESSGDVAMSTGSGDLEILAAHRGSIVGKGASGDIRIGIPAGTPVWTDISTVTGRVRSDVGGTGEPGAGQDHVELRARTVSGDVILHQI